MTAALLLMLASVVLAQERSVSGMVTDENGSGMPGVNVIQKGTANGTATDGDGRYTISIPNDAVLVFSFVGYTTTEISVGSRTSVDVQLAPDVQTLSELVVTGYTEQRKRDITGAVSVVDAEELKTIKAPNIGQQLAGRAPGVTIATSGGPGEGSNIRIRGINSITGNSDPLIIIDGVQIQGDKNLNGLNPNDIESMQVLKDAASASIYGSRANNGVIVITTKRGKSGKTVVTYDGYYGVQSAVKGYNDFLHKDPLEYAQKYHTIKNPGTGFNSQTGSSAGTFYGGLGDDATLPVLFYHPVVNNVPNTDESTYFYPLDPTQAPTLFMRSNMEGTDWWDAAFEKSVPITNHNIGISGGGDAGTFAASVDYFKQDGTMKYTFFERFSARINSNFKAGRFTFGQTFSFARSEQVTQPGGNQTEQNVMTQILKMNSIVPIYDISGVNFASAKATGFSNGSNPLAMLYRNRHDVGTNYRILGGLNGEFKILDYLSIRSNFNVDFGQNFTQDFSFPTWENREVNTTNFFDETHRTDFNWVWTNSLHFNKTINQVHEITAFVGYEALKNQARQIRGRLDGYRFTYPDLRYLNQWFAPTVNTVNSQTPALNTIVSVFGQANYTYNDKYLLSATIRRDGSSNFAESERFGVFPAVSLGWRLSEESFLESVTWLEDLKLRAGWGITGNQIIPPYNSVDRYGARSAFDASYDISGTNTGNATGYVLTDYGNAATSWEENRMTNIGFDATLLGGKLSFVFDAYWKDIVKLLYRGDYPGLAGAASAPARNTANMTNNGWDAAINYRDNITDDLGFSVGLNLSHYKNEIVKLEGGTEILFPVGPDKRFGEINAWMLGEPIGVFYGYQHDGIFETQADLDAIEQNGEAIGRFRWKDKNNDGVINTSDLGAIGSPHPKLTMGLNLGLTYKAFDFNMFLFGSFGNDIYNYNKLFTHFGFFNSNVSEEVFTDSWTPERGGSLPAIDPNDSFSLTSSSFYVENGSYIRAQNVTLGYTIPSNKYVQRLRVYVQAQNLFTITDYSGIDPALSNVNIGGANTGRENSWLGFDFGNYPSSRTFMVGVNATF
jgi:TonB-linked SusC/RagA family outer membrane protein